MTDDDGKWDSWPHSLMWNTSPAREWKEGLPIGNGKLTAMVLGGVRKDRVALNHEWLWRGKGRDRTVEPRHQYLKEIRDLFFAGKVFKAGALANEKLGGLGGVSGVPNRVDSYQPAGDLFIETDHSDEGEYRRELDLDRGFATVSYEAGGVKFRREYLAHSSLPVIVIRLSSKDGGVWRATLKLSRIDDPECTITPYASDTAIGFVGRFIEGIQFAVEAKVVTEGQVSPLNESLASLRLEAQESLILLSIAVNLEDHDPIPECRAQIEAAPIVWKELLESHIKAHRKFYRRVKLEIGENRCDVPTDLHLEAVRKGIPDEGLLMLYTNFGRYLLISSSRPGGLPANLQGKWNEELTPPWDCDLHHDVNLQMNYWPAEVCGLSECIEPLFDHVERFIPHAREVARALYNCQGVFFPIQTDPWGRATPEARGWDVWTGAAAWLAQHFWWRYEYSLDKEFLRSRAYPFFKEIAAFYQDYLVPDPRTGSLVTVPSQSPENRFVGGTSPVSLCVAATMDIELIHDVLSHAIEASDILDVDEDLRKEWRRILSQLPPLQIGRYGQLQEWLDDYEEVEPGHRHISHLFALYPSDWLTPEDEPELTRAARVSLERRLAHKGGHTGWSRAWTVCCWARLRDGDQAHYHLEKLVADFATSSLLDLHPPRIFQIDGNLGGTAGVCEMLLQSHGGTIRILPALPQAWSIGKVSGLKAQGSFSVNIEWSKGHPTLVTVSSGLGGTCRLACTDVASARLYCENSLVEFKHAGDNIIEFLTERGKTYLLRFLRDCL